MPTLTRVPNSNLPTSTMAFLSDLGAWRPGYSQLGWTRCPVCGGHGLKAYARTDALSADRFCPTCEGLGMVKK